MEEARGALVARLRGLLEQAKDHLRQRWRDRRDDVGWRGWSPRDVTVDPAEGIFGDEGQPPCKELVQHDAARVEIRATVDDAVEPPGLLGRHVGQRSLDEAERSSA